jgi:hypothetical protein
MKFIQKALIIGGISLSLGAPVASARAIGCDETGGAIVFKNTLYGIGLGGIITGLVMLSSDERDDTGRKIANGALVGAGFGLGYGLYEAVSRSSSGLVESEKPGWSKPSFVMNPVNSAYALSMRYNF